MERLNGWLAGGVYQIQHSKSMRPEWLYNFNSMKGTDMAVQYCLVLKYKNNIKLFIKKVSINFRPQFVQEGLKSNINVENECLSHYGGGGSGEDDRIVLSDDEKLVREQQFFQALTDYSNVKLLYENLEDGGNTDALLTEVESA